MKEMEVDFLQFVLFQQRDVGIARIYMALKRFEQALEITGRTKGGQAAKMLLTVLALDTEISLFSDLPVMFMHAKATYETGDINGAKTAYDQLRELPQLRQSGGIYWQVLYDRGRIARQEGDRNLAIDLFKQAVEVIEAQRATINTETNKIGFIGNKQGVYRDLIDLLFEESRFGDSFDYVERAKARALVDLLASKKTFAAGTAGGRPVAQLLANLDKAEKSAIVEDERTTASDVRRTRSVRSAAKKQIIQAAPELASLVTVTTPGVKEIQALLPANETLVEYYGEGDAFYAFAVTREDVRAVRIDGKGLLDDVGEFRAAIGDPEGKKDYRTVGARLHARLVAPITDAVKGADVTIVPHGALHYMPFNALPVGNGYLIDKYRIRVLPSAAVMKFLRQRAGQQSVMLALGNPDLGDPSYDLPGAGREARAVASGQKKASVLLRAEATESAVKTHGGEFRYLHFASHGTFDPEAPLTSALLLAGDGANDGRLTVAELYDLSLNADLVTLSACETGLGTITDGDDVVGFTRGFLYAGASSIVASLWQVEDVATSKLMQAFYKSLVDADKRAALRSAQLSVRDNHNAHPLFWAAFQLTGTVN